MSWEVRKIRAEELRVGDEIARHPDKSDAFWERVEQIWFRDEWRAAKNPPEDEYIPDYVWIRLPSEIIAHTRAFPVLVYRRTDEEPTEDVHPIDALQKIADRRRVEDARIDRVLGELVDEFGGQVPGARSGEHDE